MPEIQEANPRAIYVPRKGEVNAWDNAAFVKAVEETGKKTLIIAGVWTSVCVMFPALDAKAAGYKVYAVMDASGDPSETVSRTTLARFLQAGVIPTIAPFLGRNGTFQYYECTKRIRFGKAACSAPRIPAEALEAAVSARAVDLGFQDAERDKIVQEALKCLADDAPRIGAEMAEVRHRLG